MKRYLIALLLRLEYSMHRLDAYLASHRGDKLMTSDSLSRAWEIERRLAWMEIQS